MNLDDKIMIWLHSGLPHQFSETLFAWMSSRTTFYLPLLGLLLMTAVREDMRRGIGWWCALILLLGIGDQFGGLMKILFHELRPCAAGIDALWHAQPCSGNAKGMPSNHALTFYAASMFVIFTRPHWPRWQAFLMIAAFLVSLSRIYLAKHYPSQVIGGVFLGILLGSAGALCFNAQRYLYPLVHSLYRFARLKPWAIPNHPLTLGFQSRPDNP
ncbi:MAG: phosphatase PAP2 family protein [Candidatus Thiodiazotropha sp.]